MFLLLLLDIYIRFFSVDFIFIHFSLSPCSSILISSLISSTDLYLNMHATIYTRQYARDN